MAAYSVLINGVERECLLEEFEINETINRIPVMRGKFVSLDATFRPAFDNEIIIAEDVTRVFGGPIEFAEEAGFGGPAGDAIVTRINGPSFASYADRRFVRTALPAGTLKSMLQLLVPYLTPYGVTLDPAQVDGPDLPTVPLNYQKLTDVLNDLSGLTTGVAVSPTEPPFVWEIDYHKVLRMFQLGVVMAPVDLIEGDAVEEGDLIITPTRQNYANRIILVSNDKADVFIADDLAEQTAHGLWELVVETPAYLSPTLAQQAGYGLLSQFSTNQTEAKYNTVQLGLHPGQTQTITSAKRNVDGAFVLTEVVTRNHPTGPGLIREIVGMEGYRLKGSWQDALAGLTPVTPPGGGGGGGSVSCCDAIGPGTLAFSGYGDDPIKFLNPSGRILPPPPNDPTCGSGADGIVALSDGTVGVIGGNTPNFGTTGVGTFSADFATTVDSAAGANGFPGFSVARDDNDNFYGIKGGNGRIYRYNSLGVQTADWAAAGVACNKLAVNGAGTIAYYGKTSADTDKVYAWDLVGNASLGVFVTGAAGFFPGASRALLALSNGDVLVGWRKSATPGYVSHYNSSGALLYTYALLGGNPAPLNLTYGAEDFTVWCGYTDGNLSTYSGQRIVEIQLATGCYSHQFAPESGAFQFDGSFCVLRGRAT